MMALYLLVMKNVQLNVKVVLRQMENRTVCLEQYRAPALEEVSQLHEQRSKYLILAVVLTHDISSEPLSYTTVVKLILIAHRIKVSNNIINYVMNVPYVGAFVASMGDGVVVPEKLQID